MNIQDIYESSNQTTPEPRKPRPKRTREPKAPDHEAERRKEEQHQKRLLKAQEKERKEAEAEKMHARLIDNIKRSEAGRISILLGLTNGAPLYELLAKAVETIAFMTEDRAFLETALKRLESRED